MSRASQAGRSSPGRLPRPQRAHGDLRLVVEHLLEVGHEPFRVHRVAVEAAAHMVVDAAPCHAAQRLRDHARRLDPGLAGEALERRAAQEELEVGRPGKLGRAAEAPVPRVEALGVVLVGLLEGRARGLGKRRRPRRLAGAARWSARSRRDTTTRSASSTRRARSSLQPRAIARRMVGNPARPCRSSGGKYVPA